MKPECDGFALKFRVFNAGAPVFQFLSSRLTSAHAALLPDMFSQGLILIDDQAVSPEYLLRSDQAVVVYLAEHKEEAVDTQWRLIWENDELMAVDKPHLLPVSRTTRNLYNTLISIVRRETPYNQAHLLHRLDTETAGVILLAKNSAADRKWKPCLEQLISTKTYHAWVHGEPKWDVRVFECELSEKIGSAIRSQMYVVDPRYAGLFPKPKLSKTAFRVLRREAGCSLIECELFTGRKHQIRAQLAYLGYPIIGDKVYAHEGRYYLKRLDEPLSAADYDVLKSRHQQLTAVSLTVNIGEEIIKIDTSTF